MFENPRRGRQARNFTTNVPKILDRKSSSEQIFFPKLSLGAPVVTKLRLICSGRRLIWTPRGMPWCPLSELSEKNVTDTCVIDIKTKADKEEEGWEQ